MNIFTGMKAWIWQRISAVFILMGIFYSALSLYLNRPVSFEEWRSWVMEQPHPVLFIMLACALYIHAWIGIRDVIIDYIRVEAVKLIMFILFAFVLAANFTWLLTLLLKS